MRWTKLTLDIFCCVQSMKYCAAIATVINARGLSYCVFIACVTLLISKLTIIHYVHVCILCPIFLPPVVTMPFNLTDIES